MSAEPAAAIDAPERLTWDEVRDRYPDQWVMLDSHGGAFGGR
jgi:hypothetical protein